MSSRCITPFYKKEKIKGENIPFPCGKCPPCKKRRTSGWSFRLVKEEERSKSALFLTLTYDTEYVPITNNGYMTLNLKDLQKFFKRLRKLENEKIKYYAVGEYGSTKKRPHYHVILYNANPNNIARAWALNNKPIGTYHIGNVSDASIGYTLKYMSKNSQIPMHKNDDRIKEFSVMSKGLGSNYITDNMINWHKADLEKRMYIPIKDAKKIAMPRYYKDKMYSEQEKAKINEYMVKISLELDVKISLEFDSFTEQEKVLSERHIFAFKKMHKNAEIERKNNNL